MSFAIKESRKAYFCYKSWPHDSKIGCKPPSNLVELIEDDLELGWKRSSKFGNNRTLDN
jgi:hypothetical protein